MRAHCLIIAALSLAHPFGCGHSPPQGYLAHPQSARGLPADGAALIALADRLVATAQAPPSPKTAPAPRGASSQAPSNKQGFAACLAPNLARMERARAALLRAQAVGHNPPFAVYWRLSRVCLLMTAHLSRRGPRLAVAHEGVQHARRALALRPKRVEGHYYLALNLGRVAEVDRRLSLLKPMVEAGQRARGINPAFDSGGVLVFLGKVYLSAPAWPVSVGDSEKALELLREAVIVAPTNAMARLFLGQALLAEEEFEEARVQLSQSIKMGLRSRWDKEARQSLAAVHSELGPSTAPSKLSTKAD